MNKKLYILIYLLFTALSINAMHNNYQMFLDILQTYNTNADNEALYQELVEAYLKLDRADRSIAKTQIDNLGIYIEGSDKDLEFKPSTQIEAHQNLVTPIPDSQPKNTGFIGGFLNMFNIFSGSTSTTATNRIENNTNQDSSESEEEEFEESEEETFVSNEFRAFTEALQTWERSKIANNFREVLRTLDLINNPEEKEHANSIMQGTIQREVNSLTQVGIEIDQIYTEYLRSKIQEIITQQQEFEELTAELQESTVELSDRLILDKKELETLQEQNKALKEEKQQLEKELSKRQSNYQATQGAALESPEALEDLNKQLIAQRRQLEQEVQDLEAQLAAIEAQKTASSKPTKKIKRANPNK